MIVVIEEITQIVKFELGETTNSTIGYTYINMQCFFNFQLS